jgi:translation initiation factor eIF-2B subunit delta
VGVLVDLARDSEAATWDAFMLEIGIAVEELLAVMPAYAPPINVLHLFLASVDQARSENQSLVQFKSRVEQLGVEYVEWSQRARSQIASIVYELVPQNASIFTFTLSETVWTTLRQLWEAGKRFKVYVTESRPNSDGIDTAKRLASNGVPVTLSIDACMPALLREADLMLCGAEAILVDGSAVCKTGTYLAALAAREQGLPVYVLADSKKFDATSLRGVEHALDPIEREDFPQLGGGDAVNVAGHLFDRTPANLIRGIVTENGLLNPIACAQIMLQMPIHASLVEKLRSESHRA